jgi:hypothetical protein
VGLFLFPGHQTGKEEHLVSGNSVQHGEIRGFHGGEDPSRGLPGCDVMKCCSRAPGCPEDHVLNVYKTDFIFSTKLSDFCVFLCAD